MGEWGGGLGGMRGEGHEPGSTCFGAPDAQMFWLGQPAHADAFPASSACVPGQPAREGMGCESG
jgi:hypothetical protein